MSSNKNARQMLERQYGKGCMFQKAEIEQQIAELKTIKTYRRFLQETRYTGKKIRQLERNMTYHHLKHRADGGKTDIKNGAVVSEMAHRYMHSLPREQEEVINNMLRNYKFKIDGGFIVATDKGIEMHDPFGVELEMDLSKDIEFIEIPVYDNTKEDMEKRKKYNRAQTKREFQRKIDAALYGDEEDELDDDWYR